MISLKDLLLEDVGEEAKKRGLHHIGWGRYADKQGNLVAKSVDGRLVSFKPNEKDPEVDQPSSGEEEDKWRKSGWSPKYAADAGTLGQYKAGGSASSGVMGSAWETEWRKLPPGEVDFDKKTPSNPYVARNPDGKLARFSNTAIAAAFAKGKTLKGYDFEKDFDGSMKKLSRELRPIIKKIKSPSVSSERKRKLISLLTDITIAFVTGGLFVAMEGPTIKGLVMGLLSGGASLGTAKFVAAGGKIFGGGGKFSGGGSSGNF